MAILQRVTAGVVTVLKTVSSQVGTDFNFEVKVNGQSIDVQKNGQPFLFWHRKAEQASTKIGIQMKNVSTAAHNLIVQTAQIWKACAILD